MNEYLDMWKNYANFSGKTTIRGYWMAFLFNFLASFVLGVITGIIPQLSFLSGLYTLAVMIPGLAIVVRRLRDAGKSWGWIFISLVPIAGPIILIVMLCKPSVSSEEETVVAAEA